MISCKIWKPEFHLHKFLFFKFNHLKLATLIFFPCSFCSLTLHLHEFSVCIYLHTSIISNLVEKSCKHYPFVQKYFYFRPSLKASQQVSRELLERGIAYSSLDVVALPVGSTLKLWNESRTKICQTTRKMIWVSITTNDQMVIWSNTH